VLSPLLLVAPTRKAAVAKRNYMQILGVIAVVKPRKLRNFTRRLSELALFTQFDYDFPCHKFRFGTELIRCVSGA
jgi:hypothetical protein